jgi:hypothetical protein
MFFKVIRIEIMLLEEEIKVGPIFSCHLCCFAYLSLARFKKMDEITPFKNVPRLL